MRVSIREAVESDAENISRVDLESRRATYQGILPETYLSKLSHHENTKLWEDRLQELGTFILVAETEEELVGYVYAGRARKEQPGYEGEIFAIYLLPSHQRTGIGSALFRSAAERLSSAGINSLLIWVLAENPARKFYEAMEGKYLKSAPNYVAGMTLEGIAYGWKDTSKLK